MEIKTQRLILKEIKWEDVDAIHELHCMPEVDEFNTLGIPQNIEETEEAVKQILEEQKRDPRNAYQWKIVLRQSDTFMGMAGMFLSLDKYKLGEIYYKFFPAYWGNGYGTETSKALIKSGFEQFGLHKVEAGVATANINSIKVLEKSGMTREGLRRKILPIRGKWVDNYHYAIVEDDPRDY